MIPSEFHPTAYDPARAQWSLKFINPDVHGIDVLQDAIDNGWEPFAVTDNEVWFKRRGWPNR